MINTREGRMINIDAILTVHPTLSIRSILTETHG
jgi:hypothetical protein